MENIFTGLDVPQDVRTALEERIQKEIEAVKEGKMNDPEFIGNIRSEEAGKFFKSMEKEFKKTFPDLDLQKIEGSGLKRMGDILSAGMATIEKSKDATNQELQEKYLKLSNEFTTYKEEEVPKILGEQKNKYHARYIQDAIFKDCAEFDTVCKASARPALVEAYLHSNGYKKVWDEEKGTYDILTKDNLKPTMNDKPLSKQDIIRVALEDAEVLKKSNGNEPSGPQQSHTMPRTQPGKLSANAQRMLQTTRQDG